MPERDATLDAFVSSSTDEDADAEDAGDDSGDDSVAAAVDRPDAERRDDSDGETIQADENGQEPPESTAQTESAGSESSVSERVSKPAVTTMASSPDGAACEACGNTTMRRWRTDSGFLCEDCVDWERTPNQ